MSISRVERRLAEVNDQIFESASTQIKMISDERAEADRLIWQRGYALYGRRGVAYRCASMEAFCAVQRGQSLPIEGVEIYVQHGSKRS